MTSSSASSSSSSPSISLSSPSSSSSSSSSSVSSSFLSFPPPTSGLPSPLNSVLSYWNSSQFLRWSKLFIHMEEARERRLDAAKPSQQEDALPMGTPHNTIRSKKRKASKIHSQDPLRISANKRDRLASPSLSSSSPPPSSSPSPLVYSSSQTISFYPSSLVLLSQYPFVYFSTSLLRLVALHPLLRFRAPLIFTATHYLYRSILVGFHAGVTQAQQHSSHQGSDSSSLPSPPPPSPPHLVLTILTCLFVASKVEEAPVNGKHIIKAWRDIQQGPFPLPSSSSSISSPSSSRPSPISREDLSSSSSSSSSSSLPYSPEYLDLLSTNPLLHPSLISTLPSPSLDDLLSHEFHLLSALNMDLSVVHPHPSLLDLFTRSSSLHPNTLLNLSLHLLNSLLYLPSVLFLYPPSLISISILYIACNLHNIEYKEWINSLRIDQNGVIEVVRRIVDGMEEKERIEKRMREDKGYTRGVWEYLKRIMEMKEGGMGQGK